MPKLPFSVDKPEHSPGFLLWQTTVTWQRMIKKALEPYGIAHAQFVILAILLWFEKTRQTPTQVILATWSKLDKMTVSKSLKALTVQGLLTRSKHEKDTRAKVVQLTEKGKALASKLVPIVETIDKDFFNLIDQQDQRLLINILNKLTSKME